MVKTTILLIIVYILNLIDYWQTKYGISQCGLSIEGNPIIRFLFEHNCVELIKLIVPIVLLTILGFIIKVDKKYTWTAYFLLIAYLLLILHNFAILIRIGILF